MNTNQPQASMKVQSELMAGESIYWSGMPEPNVIFHSDDWYVIPFSLLWGGFAVFWEAGALGYWGGTKGGPSTFMVLWGIPFIVIGQYIIWGRFLVDGWLKRRTYYAVTNRRVLIVQEGWKRKVSSMFLEAIPTIDREGETTGTLWFGTKYPAIAGRGQKTRGWSRFSLGEVPVFADIENVNGVYRQVMELKEKAREGRT